MKNEELVIRVLVALLVVESVNAQFRTTSYVSYYTFDVDYSKTTYFATSDYKLNLTDAVYIKATFKASCPFNQKIKLQVVDIDMPGRDSTGDCRSGYRAVFYDGPTDKHNVLAIVCGTETTGMLQSSGCEMFMHYTKKMTQSPFNGLKLTVTATVGTFPLVIGLVVGGGIAGVVVAIAIVLVCVYIRHRRQRCQSQN